MLLTRFNSQFKVRESFKLSLAIKEILCIEHFMLVFCYSYPLCNKTEAVVWVALLLIAMNLFPLLLDIDECTTNQHRCSQRCSDTVGSYTCSCVDGFTLDGDGFTCNGNFHTHK